MKAEVLHDVLEASIEDVGDDGRDYLGMSQIGRCPRRVYLDLVEGREEMRPEAKRRCHEGTLHQADVVRRLEEEGLRVVNQGGEIVANLDGFGRRFLGHIDGEVDGDLLEIKSVETQEDLDDIRRRGPWERDRAQVQLYMRYGGYARTLIVYKVRANGMTWVWYLMRDDEVGEALERRAKALLRALDEGQPPACECERCR